MFCTLQNTLHFDFVMEKKLYNDFPWSSSGGNFDEYENMQSYEIKSAVLQ